MGLYKTSLIGGKTMTHDLEMRVTAISKNKKTGPMAVVTTLDSTCPDTCPLKDAGCYARSGPMRLVWDQLNFGKIGFTWKEGIASILALPRFQVIRLLQAGDLPGKRNRINLRKLRELAKASVARGKRAFCYTHKPMTPANIAAIREANKVDRFTVNLSADSLEQADAYKALDIAPVVVTLPSTQTRAVKTPAGNTVAICPATLSDIRCTDCMLCARDRAAIIGFPAHGNKKKALDRALLAA